MPSFPGGGGCGSGNSGNDDEEFDEFDNTFPDTKPDIDTMDDELVVKGLRSFGVKRSGHGGAGGSCTSCGMPNSGWLAWQVLVLVPNHPQPLSVPLLIFFNHLPNVHAIGAAMSHSSEHYQELARGCRPVPPGTFCYPCWLAARSTDT